MPARAAEGVDSRCAPGEEPGEADEHPGRLPLGVVESRLVLRVRERNARARDHDQARAAQEHGREHEQAVGMAPSLRAGAHLSCLFLTSALNRRPRSSKSFNMSKLL